MRALLPLTVVAVGCVVGLADVAMSQSPRDRVGFTVDQATRGRAHYAAQCAACHGPKLEGGAAPPLAGAGFARVWGQPSRSVDDLFYVIRTTMPRPRVGSLTADQYLEIVAYLLEQNGMAAGPTPLAATPALASLRLPVGVPGPTARPKETVLIGDRSVPRGTGPTQADLNQAATSQSWPYHTHDYSGTRHSPASEIQVANAPALTVVCAYQLGDMNFFQAGPIVWGNTIYLSTSRVTVAIDATTCRERWRHEWQAQDTELWPNNRGVAIKDGYVVRGTADGYLLALDAEDGALLWARQVAKPAAGETITMPPLIWNDLVFIGPAGSENNARGWVGAFRLATGEPVWRFNTVPAAGEPGSETWGNPAVPIGGGAVWTPLALDLAAEELYVAVTNPAPDLPRELRPGKNLYTNALVSLDARSGALRWYEQLVPADFHDWDLTQIAPLFRVAAGGKERDVVATVGKDGILRLLDRVTRARIWETPVTTQLNVAEPLSKNRMVRFCPGVLGGVEWNGPAWSPAAKLLVVPAVDWCTEAKLADTTRFIAGENYMGGEFKPLAEKQGWLTAVDARSGAVVWRYRSKEPMVAAVTTTAGGLALTGEITGDFLVLDLKSGTPLYRFNTGGPIGGGLVTYVAGGRQYIAVTSGRPSGWFGATGAPTVFIFGLPSK